MALMLEVTGFMLLQSVNRNPQANWARTVNVDLTSVYQRPLSLDGSISSSAGRPPSSSVCDTIRDAHADNRK
jgi:hypothetical protein